MNMEVISSSRRHVAFGIPSLSNRVTLGFLKSWTATVDLLSQSGIDLSVISIPGDPFVAKARNRIATEFLNQTDAEALFFLDDDIDWPAQKVIDLINRPELVVAGVYPQKKEKTDFPTRLGANPQTGDLLERDGLIQATLVPTGFLRIKRSVIELLSRPPTRVFLDTVMKSDGREAQQEFYGIFESGVGPQEDAHAPWWWGEDYIFCRKCQVLGIEIWVDPDISFGHAGQKRWEDHLKSNLGIYRTKARSEAARNNPTAHKERLREALKSVTA